MNTTHISNLVRLAGLMIALAVAPLGCSQDDAKGAGDKKGQGDDDNDGDDDDDDDGTDGGSVIVPQDMGDGTNNCLPGRDDCAEDEKCQPYVSTPGACCVDAAQCVPLMGNKQAGEDCTRMETNDDCDRDVFCFAGTSGKLGPGYCKQMCDADSPDSCKDKGFPDAECVPYNDGILPICETQCHPLRPDSCLPEQGCFPGGDAFNCNRPDPEPGKGKDNDDCHTVQSCNPGLFCANATFLDGCESDSCCTNFCDATGDGVECTEPETCVMWYSEDEPAENPDLMDVGACGLAEDE